MSKPHAGLDVDPYLRVKRYLTSLGFIYHDRKISNGYCLDHRVEKAISKSAMIRPTARNDGVWVVQPHRAADFCPNGGLSIRRLMHEFHEADITIYLDVSMSLVGLHSVLCGLMPIHDMVSTDDWHDDEWIWPDRE